METNPPKVNKWDTSALKNALDDCVKDVLSVRFNYMEGHHLVDGRLIISGIAVGFSLFALLWDYLYPFPQSRSVLFVCAFLYFVMMGVLTWYTTYIERNIFCVAAHKDPAGLDKDDVWKASSTLKRFDNKYNLTLSETVGKSGKMKDASAMLPVEKCFDQSGRLVYSAVEEVVIRLHGDVVHKKK